MNRLLTLLIAIACVLSSTARDDWYEPPITLAVGETIISDDPIMVRQATVHARIALDSDGGTWALIWNYTTPSDYCRATLTLPKEDRFDNHYRQIPTLIVEKITAGRADTIGRLEPDNMDVSGRFNSLRLTYNGHIATLSGGASEAKEYCTVPFSPQAATVAVYTCKDARCQRLQSQMQGEASVPHSAYADVQALIDHVTNSTDRMEGVWEYMDRNVNEGKATLGGRYTIATVRRGDHYDIVYLRGAQINSELWHALMIKGRLHPTIFIGDNDLEWYDAYGTLISGDANARLSDDGAIITISIPEIGAQIRFRRKSLAQ